MDDVSIWRMPAALCLGLGLGYALTAVARWTAPRLGLIDRPDGDRKLHLKPTPLMGGVAVYASLLGGAAFWLVLNVVHSGTLDPAGGPLKYWPLFVSGGLFCALGLWDDKWPLRPRVKFLGQIVASLPFALWARSVDVVNFFGFVMPLEAGGSLFTVAWLVVCVNVINLVDGLDGVAATIGLVAISTIMALSYMSGRFDLVLLTLIIGGSLAGFLIHNWPPAKIFLGDSGSHVIGFLIGALSIEAAVKRATGFTLATPMVLISLPVFDTFMAIIRRKLSGRGIGQADRGHIHHRLQDRGLTRLQALLVIAGLCLAMAAAVIVSILYSHDGIAVFACVSILALLVIGRVFGDHETVMFIRCVRMCSDALSNVSETLQHHELRVRWKNATAEQQAAMWEDLRAKVADLGGVHLAFTCWQEDTNEIASDLTWGRERSVARGRPLWQFQYRLARDNGTVAELNASGFSREGQKLRFYGDLFDTFDAFCRYWPADAEPATALIIPQIDDTRRLPLRRAA